MANFSKHSSHDKAWEGKSGYDIAYVILDKGLTLLTTLLSWLGDYRKIVILPRFSDSFSTIRFQARLAAAAMNSTPLLNGKPAYSFRTVDNGPMQPTVFPPDAHSAQGVPK